MVNKRVLILTKKLVHSAGISITLKYLSNGYYAQGYFSEYFLNIVVLEDSSLDIVNVIKQNKININTLNSKNIFVQISRFLNIKLIYNYDLYICTCFRSYYILKLLFPFKKIVLWWHGSYNFKNPIKRLLFKLTNNYPSITNSIFTARVNNLKNYVVVYNGVDKPKKEIKRNELLKRFCMPDDNIFIGNVGYWTLNKNQITLVKAFNLLLEHYPNIYLIIIGRQTELTKYANEILKDKKNNYIFLDEVPGALEFMHIFDIYVHTSLMEGFSNAITEAMASGCPVVTSASGAIQEMFKNNEDCIFYEPTENYENCAYAIKSLLDDKILAKKIIRNAKLKIKYFYNSDIFAEKFFAALKNI